MPIVTFNAVQSILFHDWDPIGVSENPRLSDEYDKCVPAILRLVSEGATSDEIAAKLEEMEDSLSSKAPLERRIRAATMLSALARGH